MTSTIKATLLSTFKILSAYDSVKFCAKPLEF
jgi:hypothetical protein